MLCRCNVGLQMWAPPWTARPILDWVSIHVAGSAHARAFECIKAGIPQLVIHR